MLDVCASTDNSNLASGSKDKSVIYWDVSTGQIVRRFRGHAGAVNCVTFNEESTVVVSGSVDNSVRCWDCRSRKNQPIQTLGEAKDTITSVQASDQEIVTSSIDGFVRRYDLRRGQMHADNIEVPVTCTKLSKDGQCLLVATHDSTVRLLDKETGQLLNEYKGHKNVNYSIECALNKDDDHIISGSEDGYLYSWDLIQGDVRHKLPVCKNPVITMATHPVKNILVTASTNQMLVFGDESFDQSD